jgi:hypothetical protein
LPNAYLRVGHAAHLVLVELVEGGGSLPLANVEAAALNDALDLAGVHAAIVVKVQAVEGLVHVEAGLALETLANGLGGNLNLEVNAPHVSELNLSVAVEAVVTAVDRVLVVGSTAVEHVRVVAISGEEGIGELVEVESQVLVGVVAGDEKVNLVAGGENADSGETLADVSSRDVAAEVNVKDAESVVQVEVGLVGQSHLGLLELTLKGDNVAETVDKSVLLLNVENGLHAGGHAGVGVARGVTDGAAVHGRASHGGAADGTATNGTATNGADTDWGADAHGGAADGRAAVDGGVSTGHGARLEGRAVAGALHKAAAVVGRLSAGHRVSNAGAGRGAGAAHEVGELGVAETSITISVHAADDGKELALTGVVAGRAEERAEVVGVDTTIVVLIDGAVSGKSGVVVAALELTLEDIEAALEVDLLLDHVEERALNVASEAIEAANAASGAVDSNVPEQVVLAGEEHLEETKFSRVSFCGVLIIIIGQQAG